jgi:hypothetical protein
MSERSPEAERVDESIVGGSASSIESDVAASGTDGGDGLLDNPGAGAGTATEDSHAADVAAGYDDADDAPVQPPSQEDGGL